MAKKGRVGKNIRGVARVEGIDELVQKLHQLGADVKEELEAAVVDGAEVIKKEANRLAPGPHIDTEVEESSDTHVTVAIGPVEEKWFYRFFELGATAHEITGSPLAFEDEGELVVTRRVHHPGIAARPFLRPAFDKNKDKAIETAKKRLRKRIERLTRR